MRDHQHPSHSISPLYKGFSEENVRDGPLFVKVTGLTDRSLHGIEDVTTPLFNSINEKCARIRGAFVGQFDDHMARNYYIDGLRGEAKKITLPRDLVVWE